MISLVISNALSAIPLITFGKYNTILTENLL